MTTLLSNHRKPWTQSEIKQLKALAGTKPACVLSKIFGRSKIAIHCKIKSLGVDGRIHGEHHWNCKIDSVTAQMIACLYDCGFSVNEISRVFDKNKNTVNDICAARTRVRDATHTDIDR